MTTMDFHWEANCRGVDEFGTPLVAVHGSQDIDANKRARLIQAAPQMLHALKVAQTCIFMLEGASLTYNILDDVITTAEGTR